MAWPIDARNVDFALGTVVTDTFLDDIQDKIYAVYGGSKSVVKLYVDGVGNAAPPNGAGTIRTTGSITIDSGGLTVTAGGATIAGGNLAVSSGTATASGAITSTGGALVASHSTAGKLTLGGAISSATAGAGQGVAIGDQYKDTTPIAWGWFDNGGAITLRRSANVSSVTRNSAGTVTVVLVNGPANRLVPIATFVDNAVALAGYTISVEITNTTTFTIRTVKIGDTATPITNAAAMDMNVAFVCFGG